MKRKQIIDMIVAVFLILCGSVLLIFPIINFINIKQIFIGIFIFYGILNLIQFILTRKDKDFEGLLTFIISLISLILAFNLDIAKTPWYLALTLFIWIIGMSLIKLKKADYYNDRKNDVWILKLITLIFFILSGLLATINLYYAQDIQVLVLGFFFLIHGILELLDPLTVYLLEKKNHK